MESFHDKLIAKADTMVDEILTTYAKPLPSYVKDAWADDVHWEAGNQVRPNNIIACPFSSEWKCWPVRNGDAAIGGGSTGWQIGSFSAFWLETGPTGYQDAQVTIVKTPQQSRCHHAKLKWANRAGVRWTLTTTPDKTKLTVGSDCPYFNAGHKQVTVIWEGDRVSGLSGPFDELYEKSGPQ
jgi:hypothetical protein